MIYTYFRSRNEFVLNIIELEFDGFTERILIERLRARDCTLVVFRFIVKESVAVDSQ